MLYSCQIFVKKNNKILIVFFLTLEQHHNDKPDVWIRAILWEYNENFNDERVKSLLVRAQQHLPAAQKLYTTGFLIELENKSKLDEAQATQRAEAIYGSSKAQKFINIEFYIEMLEILDKFSYAHSIQQQILDDMQEMCPHAELRWHTMAQRELKGLNSKINCAVDFSGLIKMECDSENNKNEDNAANDSKNIDLNLKKMKIEDLATPPHHTNTKRIELCIKTYEDAVKDVIYFTYYLTKVTKFSYFSTFFSLFLFCIQINSAKMWDYYVNAMIELNRDLSSQKEIKQKALIKAFGGACQFNHLTEENSIQYIELMYELNPSDENIEKVFQKATKANGRSMRLWLLCMRYYIQRNNSKKVRETFRVSKELLGRNGVEIWELYMMYIKSSGNADAHKEFKHFNIELSRQHNPAFDRLKANILEMLASTAGMKAVQETYELFTKNYPICDEIHAMMTEIDGRQVGFLKTKEKC